MGYPVLAQAPTLRYTAGKFVRRNRAAVACAGVCLLAALIALGAFVAQYRRAQRERAMAEKRFHAARQMAQLLMFDAPDKVAGIPGTIDARKWMAERATDYLEQLAADVQGDANLALSVAKGYRQVAFQQFNVNAANLNDPTGALGSLERGAAVLESVPNAGPETLFEMIQNRLQRPYFVLGRTKEAIENEDRAALLVERLGSMGDPRSRDLQARIWFQQAANIARPETRRLELWGKLEGYYASRLAEKPGDLERLRNLALIHKNVSGVYGFRHEWEKALAHDRMAIELDEKRREGRPEDPNILMDLSFDYGRLGQDLCGAGRSEEGVLSLRRAVSMRRPLAEREPEDKRAPERLAWMLGELGKQLLKGRGAKEGEQLVREALAIREKISAAGAGENSSPHLHQMIALVEEGRGRRREACRAWLAAARALPADTSGLIWRQVNPQEIRGRAAACGAR
jgi:tetratricopeptide (TPR) repeat protein